MTDHRSRRWFQLSLKSLFLLTLLVAAFFAGYSLAMRQAEEERRRGMTGEARLAVPEFRRSHFSVRGWFTPAEP